MLAWLRGTQKPITVLGLVSPKQGRPLRDVPWGGKVGHVIAIPKGHEVVVSVKPNGGLEPGSTRAARCDLGLLRGRTGRLESRPWIPCPGASLIASPTSTTCARSMSEPPRRVPAKGALGG